MDSQTPLADEEKEAVLKMAGVLIRTDDLFGWIALRGNKLILTSAASREYCIDRAFYKFREQTK